MVDHNISPANKQIDLSREKPKSLLLYKYIPLLKSPRMSFLREGYDSLDYRFNWPTITNYIRYSTVALSICFTL
jgi:hypothetical protein